MADLSMNEAVAYTGMGKHVLQAYAAKGELGGAHRDPGRTGHWHISQESLDQLLTRLGKERRSESESKPLVTAKELGFDEEWVTLSEATKLIGAHPSTLQKRVSGGKLASRTEEIGGRKITLVRRADIKPANPVMAKIAKARVAAEKTKPNDFLLLKRAAQKANIREGTVYNWVSRGLVKGERVSLGPRMKGWMVSLSSLLEFAKGRSVSGYNKRGERRAYKKYKSDSMRTQIDLSKLVKVSVPNLTGELIRLAELVKDGGFKVVRLEVGLEYTGKAGEEE